MRSRHVCTCRCRLVPYAPCSGRAGAGQTANQPSCWYGNPRNITRTLHLYSLELLQVLARWGVQLEALATGLLSRLGRRFCSAEVQSGSWGRVRAVLVFAPRTSLMYQFEGMAGCSKPTIDNLSWQ